ncbi:beta strand repeat-containing protein [Maribacter hydrothermalis]|nr:Calx-beta domain-containing protein [Maribacter hydrothermalis]
MSLKHIYCFLMLFSTISFYSQETYLDNFSNVSYSNNNGTQNFSTDWIETGDSNAGPTAQYLRINSNRLELYYLYNENIRRSANLSSASSATLSFNWQSVNLSGSRALDVQVSSNGGASYTSVGTITGNTTGTFNQDITSFISANTTVRFAKTNTNWNSNQYAYIDNFQITTTTIPPTPALEINDVIVNEDGGSVTFTVTHNNIAASGPYVVTYQTANGSADFGSDYTSDTNTLNFNGQTGRSRTVTISILDDTLLENSETFFLQLISSTDPAVDISDFGTATITDDDSISMTNGTTSNDCGLVFLDPGSFGDYGNNENVIHTLCPEPGTDYVSVTFTSFDVRSGDSLFIYDGSSTSASLIGQYDNNNIPSIINASNGGTGCLTFRFVSNNSNTGTGFEAEINCFEEGPLLVINDVSLAEDGGNMVFTVTSTRAAHGINIFLFGFVNTQFTVNYTTVNGSAIGGSDFTTTTGTLTFSGAIGNQRTISVPITNDGIPELDENFFIEFTSANAPNGQVNFSDTGEGTINSQILANVPLTLFNQFDGRYDYATTGGTLRTGNNDSRATSAAITTNSSNQLTSIIPNTGVVEKAYLYWAHSGGTRDENVTFEGQTVSANFVYQTVLEDMSFYGYVSDVTNIISGIGNLNTNVFDFSNLSIDNTGSYYTRATTLGGWSLMVFYEDQSLPAVNINLYQGFDGLSNEGTSFTLDSFYAIAGVGAKATFLSWEGDASLDGNTGTNPEALSITNESANTFNLTGDGGNPGNNAYNSTIYDNTISPVYNTPNIYGVDLDTYDISTYISPGDSQVTANVDMAQDFVINNVVVIKVPSNLIAGTVFEDMNYPGGNGRNQTLSSGTGVSGAIVELFEDNGTFVERKTTNINGDYSFGGMEDGDYFVKVVNNTVSSNRTGGLNCGTCFPIQTFRSYGNATTVTEVTTEIGGANPAASIDAALGILNNAQSISEVTVASNGVTGIDFGFNFNTIVNTNENGQGSLEQFILNSNALDESTLNIEANSMFNPALGDDVSIFMIPPSGDSFGRTADSNFSNGYFDILLSNGNPLSIVTGDNTIIDGRTQTAYSGDTNVGVLGSGGNTVGVSNSVLPNFNRPEIQVHRDNGDVFRTSGTNVGIRNLSIFASSNSGIRVDGGSLSVSNNIIGLDATGITTNDLNIGIENLSGNLTADGNYIANSGDNAILVNGGTSSIIQNNHLANNGNAACDDAILLTGGSGIQILQNLIDTSASTAIDGEAISGGVIISENSLTSSGQNGGNCTGSPQQMAIRLAGDGSEIISNKIYSNGGAGISIIGGVSNRISQNSIYANGTVSDALGIDLNNDGVTLNDSSDSDSGPNNRENFPVISGAYISGTNLVVTGWAASGTTVEVFFTDINEGSALLGDNQLGLSQDYGEGQTYIGSAVEGSAADQDGSISSYLDDDGNTDNTNKYKFVFPLPSGTVLGDQITTTGTRSNSTSEFSPMVVISAYTVITNRRITYRIKSN